MNRNAFRFAILAIILLAGRQLLAQHSGSQPVKSGTPQQLPSQGLQAPNDLAAIDHAGIDHSAIDHSAIDEDIELLKQDVRARSKLIVAAEMDLTDDEAKKFWPIYDQYSSERAQIDDSMAAVIRDYLQTYETMDGDGAESYLRKRAAIEESVMQLRLKYIPIYRKAFSGRLTALFFQIDWRLELLTNLQLAQMPMFDPKP